MLVLSLFVQVAKIMMDMPDLGYDYKGSRARTWKMQVYNMFEPNLDERQVISMQCSGAPLMHEQLALKECKKPRRSRLPG